MPQGKGLAMKKQFPITAMLALCAAVGAAQLADLILYTDAAGFVTAGPAALRYGGWLLLGLFCLLAGRLAAPRPAALTGRCVPLGSAMLAAGMLLAAQAAVTIPAFLRGEKLIWVDLLTAVAAALWFLRFGLRALRGAAAGRLPGASSALAVLPCFFWLLLRRFELAPAGVERLSCTVRVLSAAAALWFVTLLVKVFLTPGMPFGRALCGAGLIVFGYGTCLELPRCLWEAARGAASASTVCTGLCLGTLGLCGAFAALAAAQEDLPDGA